MADKVEYINYVKELPSEVSRQAALALFFKRYQEAEQILVQSKLFYRAVKMNIKLYRWEHALDLAYQFKKHVNTVVAYRNRYLERIGKEENLKKFLKAREEVGEISWPAIKEEIKGEKEREKKMK
jgi:intraflagellar transport protein 80